MELFRVLLQVGDLEGANVFYSKLFGVPGRLVGGGRCYFDLSAGAIFAVVSVAQPSPHAESVYLCVPDESIGALVERAKEMGCTSNALVHDEAAGELLMRPWGERCIYCVDPWGNRVCFIQSSTRFTGKRA